MYSYLEKNKLYSWPVLIVMSPTKTKRVRTGSLEDYPYMATYTHYQTLSEVFKFVTEFVKIIIIYLIAK